MRDFEHDAIQTCAADGSCQEACPVAIDTGALMKEFRRRERGAREESVALAMARNYAAVERTARAGVAAGALAQDLLGARRLASVPAALRSRVSVELVPIPPARLPAAAAALPHSTRTGAAGVYVPACINRIFGNAAGLEQHPSLPEALLALSARAGRPLWIPDDVAGHCCATPWASKGYRRGQDHMAARTAAALWRWSDGARLPVVIDASSCAHGLLVDLGPRLDDAERERYERIEILDAIAWVHDELLTQLDIRHRLASVAVHPTCSASQLNLADKLHAIATALADEVVTPASAGCCGMAGDRGLLHPELPASALRDEALELAEHDVEGHVCSNRTCEIALQEHTGAPYASFVLALERATRP